MSRDDTWMSFPRSKHLRTPDRVQLRELSVQVGVTLARNLCLVRPCYPARAVAGVQRIHRLHTHDHLGEGREAKAVERVEACVVAQIDVDLGATGVLSSPCEGERATQVAVSNWLVCELDLPPRGGNGRVSRQAELCNEVGYYAEDPDVIVESVPHEVVEPVGRVR